jgi:hypothetical protein
VPQGTRSSIFLTSLTPSSSCCTRTNTHTHTHGKERGEEAKKKESAQPPARISSPPLLFCSSLSRATERGVYAELNICRCICPSRTALMPRGMLSRVWLHRRTVRIVYAYPRWAGGWPRKHWCSRFKRGVVPEWLSLPDTTVLSCTSDRDAIECVMGIIEFCKMSGR